MEQYISKDALVAEIEKRKNFNSTLNAYSRLYEDYAILSFINTLEVKEADLEKEISFQWSKFCLSDKDKGSFVKVAQHFFELGLKAQKGEKV